MNKFIGFSIIMLFSFSTLAFPIIEVEPSGKQKAVLIPATVTADRQAKSDSIKLTSDNTVVLGTGITAAATDTAFKALQAVSMKAKGKPVYLVMDSSGGDVDAAMKLKRDLDSIPNLTLVCSKCYSAAGFLFVTAKHRLVMPFSSFMTHLIYMNHVTAIMAIDITMLNNFIVQSFAYDTAEAAGMKMAVEPYIAKIRNSENEEWWLEGYEIVQAHGADKMVLAHCDELVKSLVPRICSEM